MNGVSREPAALHATTGAGGYERDTTGRQAGYVLKGRVSSPLLGAGRCYGFQDTLKDNTRGRARRCSRPQFSVSLPGLVLYSYR